MSPLRRLRLMAGAAVYDWPPFERLLHSLPAAGPPGWVRIRNRNERITFDSRGARCHWRFTSDLHLAKVFPSTGSRLMRRAFGDWPLALCEERGIPGDAQVSFIIGHRGTARLPHLLQTLRSIAGQVEVPVECIVVEQSARAEIRERIPDWVRYVHTPVPSPDFAYCRSWTFNVGARLATGRVLVLHDNDMLVPRRYAAELLERVAEGWRFIDLKRFIFYLARRESEAVFQGCPAVPGLRSEAIIQNLSGGSIAVERDSYFAIGGFDEQFVGWGGEDNDFRERAETLGRIYDFGYLPILHLFHDPQPGKEDGSTAALARYRQLESVPPAERVAALVAREQGRVDRPAEFDARHPNARERE